MTLSLFSGTNKRKAGLRAKLTLILDDPGPQEILTRWRAAAEAVWAAAAPGQAHSTTAEGFPFVLPPDNAASPPPPPVRPVSSGGLQHQLPRWQVNGTTASRTWASSQVGSLLHTLVSLKAAYVVQKHTSLDQAMSKKLRSTIFTWKVENV